LNNQPGHNEPSAEQCGQFPEAGIHQPCQQRWKGKETTSKPRTAAAGGALASISNETSLKNGNIKKISNV